MAWKLYANHIGFDFIWQVAEATGEEIGSLRVEHDGRLQVIQKTLRHRWWSRVWVVPEVARGHWVVVKSGQDELPWETLSTFLLCCHLIPNFRVLPKVVDFAKAIGDLKRPDYSDPPRGLVDLATRFRHRVAGDPHDKVFALGGLLQSASSETLQSDYGKPVWEIFAAFSRWYILRSVDLSLMTLAESR